ncbi:MAG: BrnT family toxin [Chloroflexi bacterium]|nr:BrnT family toxin [Chloroflexota bacterium]
MEFEWDPRKAALNLRRRGVSLREAATVFGDPLSVTAPDPDHPLEENRYVVIGQSYRRRLPIVSHTERGDRIRLISARELTRWEREAYEEDSI